MREGRFAAAAFTLLAAAACSNGGHAQPSAVLEVRVAPVARGAVSAPVELSGNVVASRQSTLSAVVPGRLAELRVRVGSHVRGGDVVATIDDATYRAQQKQALGDVARAQGDEASARSALIAAQARADLARDAARRAESLYGTGDVSRQSFDQAHADYVASLAAVAQASAAIAAQSGARVASAGALAMASSQLADTVVRAPFDGTIVRKLADPGTVVVPGTPVVELQADSAPEIDVTVPQDRAGDARAGQEIPVRLDAFGDRVVEGRVLSVTALDDPALRSVLVKVSLPGIGALPGTYASVEIPGRSRTGATVPLSAIVTRAGQTGVFVVSNGVANFAPVRTGAADASFVLVDGLRASDRLVAIDDTSRLFDGAAVTVRR